MDLQDSNFWNTKLDVLSPVRNSLCVQGAVWGLLAACDNHHLQLQRIPPLRYALLWSRKLKLIVLIFDTFQSLSAICRDKEVPGGGGVITYWSWKKLQWLIILRILARPLMYFLPPSCSCLAIRPHNCWKCYLSLQQVLWAGGYIKPAGRKYKNT